MNSECLIIQCKHSEVSDKSRQYSDFFDKRDILLNIISKKGQGYIFDALDFHVYFSFRTIYRFYYQT